MLPARVNEVEETPFDITTFQLDEDYEPPEFDLDAPPLHCGTIEEGPDPSREVQSRAAGETARDGSNTSRFNRDELPNSEGFESDFGTTIRAEQDAANKHNSTHHPSEGIPSVIEQTAVEEQPNLNEGTNIEEVYDPEQPLTVTLPMSRDQEMKLEVAAEVSGLEKPLTYLPDGFEWVPRLQYVMVPKERDFGGQPTLSRKRKSWGVDERSEPISKKQRMKIPQASSQVPVNNLTLQPEPVSVNSNRNRSAVFPSEGWNAMGHMPRVDTASSSERWSAMGQVQGADTESGHQKPSQEYEYGIDVNSDIARLAAVFGKNKNNSSFPGVDEYRSEVTANVPSVTGSIPNDWYDLGPSRGSSIMPSPSISLATTNSSGKRKADDSEDPMSRPVKKAKIGILPPEKRKDYFLNHPASTESLPSGISDEDIVRYYPNHLFGPLILRIWNGGIKQKRMCEMIYGPPQSEESKKEQHKVINALLNRVKAEMKAQNININEAMPGSREKTEEARISRSIADAERKANGTNKASRGRGASQPINIQQGGFQQTAFQATPPPIFGDSVVDPQLLDSAGASSYWPSPQISPALGLTSPFDQGALPGRSVVPTIEQDIDHSGVSFTNTSNDEPGLFDDEPLPSPTYENTWGTVAPHNSVMEETRAAFDRLHPKGKIDVLANNALESQEQVETQTFARAYQEPFLQVQLQALAENPLLKFSQRDLRKKGHYSRRQ